MKVLYTFPILLLVLLAISCEQEDLIPPQGDSPVVALEELYIPGPEFPEGTVLIAGRIKYWVFVSSTEGELLASYALEQDTTIELSAEITSLPAFHVSWGDWFGTDCVPCNLPMSFETLTNVHCQRLRVESQPNSGAIADRQMIELEFTDIDIEDFDQLSGLVPQGDSLVAYVSPQTEDLVLMMRFEDGRYYLGQLPLVPGQEFYRISFAETFELAEFEEQTLRFRTANPSLTGASLVGYYSDDCETGVGIRFPTLETETNGEVRVGIPTAIDWTNYRYNLTHDQGRMHGVSTTLPTSFNWVEPDLRVESSQLGLFKVRHSDPNHIYTATFTAEIPDLTTYVHWRIRGDLLSPLHLPPFPEAGLTVEVVELLRAHQEMLTLDKIEGFKSTALADYAMQVALQWGPAEDPELPPCETWHFYQKVWKF